MRTTFPQYLANLAINAPALGFRFVDAVYWTLVVEITFYGAITVVIMSGGIRHIQRLVAGWVLLQAACVFLPRSLPMVGINYYFIAAGAVFALYYQRRNDRLNLALLFVSLLLCVRAAVHNAQRYHFDPMVAVAMTIGVFTLFLFMRDRTFDLPWAKRIGSFTYPLYLLHFYIGMTMFSWWINEENKWLVVGAVSLGMIGVSLAIDHVMEFRSRSLWLRLAELSIGRPFAWWDRRLGTQPADQPAERP